MRALNCDILPEGPQIDRKHVQESDAFSPHTYHSFCTPMPVQRFQKFKIHIDFVKYRKEYLKFFLKSHFLNIILSMFHEIKSDLHLM